MVLEYTPNVPGRRWRNIVSPCGDALLALSLASSLQDCQTCPPAQPARLRRAWPTFRWLVALTLASAGPWALSWALACLVFSWREVFVLFDWRMSQPHHCLRLRTSPKMAPSWMRACLPTRAGDGACRLLLHPKQLVALWEPSVLGACRAWRLKGPSCVATANSASHTEKCRRFLCFPSQQRGLQISIRAAN